MFTITPPPRSIIEGSTAFEHRKTLFKTTSTSRSHTASSIFSTSSPSAMAALLTSTSTGPRRESILASIDCTSAPELTSAVTATAPGISDATSSARSLCQSTTATPAPSAANRRAITRPIPDPEPVMTTTLPGNRIRPGRWSRSGSGSQDPVLVEDLPNAGALTQDVADGRLARHLLEGLANHLVLQRGRHHDHAVLVGEDQVAVCHRHASREGLSDADPFEPALGVGRGHAGCKDGKPHVLDSPRVAAEAVHDGAAAAACAGVRAQKLSPERRLELALHGGHDHLARTDTVEKVHEQPVRLLGKLRDRNREHGRRSAGHLRPRIKRPHLGSHHLVPGPCLIQDAGENRRVEAASDRVEVLRRVPLSRGRAPRATDSKPSTSFAAWRTATS